MSDGYIDSFYELVANVVSWIIEWLVALLPYPAPPQDFIAIFMPDDETHTGIWSTRNGSTYFKEYRGNVEDAVKAFARNVPPNAVHAVFVSITSAVLPTLVKRAVRALKAAGYANIRTLGDDAYTVSASIDAANVRCEVGDSLGVLNHLRGVAIFQKTDSGYKQMMPMSPIEISKYPALKHIIECPFNEETLESQEPVCQSSYPDKQLYFPSFPSIDSHQLIANHAWRNANGTAFVDETVSMILDFRYNGVVVPLIFDHVSLPNTKTFQLDIGEAQQLNVYANFIDSLITKASIDVTPFETLSFEPKKDRILNVTVTINLHQIPVVEVKPVDPVKPSLTQSQKVCVNIDRFSIPLSVTTYQYQVIGRCGTTNSISFLTIDGLVADLTAKVPSNTVGFVRYNRFQYAGMYSKLGKCYRRLRDYSRQYLDNFDVEVATVLYGYNVTVTEGECVLLWLSPDLCCILKRSGTAFQYLGIFNPNDLQTRVRLEKYKFKTVVFCKPLSKINCIETFGGQNVIVGDVEAARRRYESSYLSELLAHGHFGEFTVPQFIDIEVTASWYNTTISFILGTDMPISFEWKAEVDLGKALEVKVAISYWRSGHVQHSSLNVEVGDHSCDYAVLTFCIEDLFDVKVTCAPLPLGRTPRPLSFCLWVERTPTGIRRTLYSRDSDRAIVENFSNIFATLDSFTLAKHSAIFFDASSSTVAEREEWQKIAEDDFRVTKFVNPTVLKLNSILFNADLVNLADNKTVLVCDMTAVEKSGQKAPITYVLQSHQKKLKLNKIIKAKIGKVYDNLESVDHVFVAVEDASKPPILPAHLNSVFLQASAEKVSKYLFSKVDTDPEAESVVADIAGITFIAEWKGAKQVFNTEFDTIPLSRTISCHIGETTSLKIRTAYFNGKKRHLLKEITFDTPLDRVVVLNLAVDSMLVPAAKHVRSDLLPSTIFEFTTDNRVIVRSHTIDEIEYPAYVSFVDKNVIIGEGALAQQQLHPDCVVYDIFRMLASDFDPDHPDPSWAFETVRGDGDEVLVDMGDYRTTAIVCFGLIVSAIKKNIEERSSKNLTDIGIKLPAGSSVAEDAKNGVSGMIHVNLVIFT